MLFLTTLTDISNHFAILVIVLIVPFIIISLKANDGSRKISTT